MLHNRAGELFAVEPDGSVVTEAGKATDYRIVLSGDDAAGVRAGDVLLGGRAAGSIYLAHEQAPEDCLFQHRGSHLLMLTSDDDAPPGPSRSTSPPRSRPTGCASWAPAPATPSS